MPYYDSEHLFRALSDARERVADVPPELHEGAAELLTVLLLSGGEIPDKLDRLVDVTVDCAPDVRPVVSSTIASLLARPYDEQRKIVETVRGLLVRKREPDPFADLFKGL
jgi:hypothetical protein